MDDLSVCVNTRGEETGKEDRARLFSAVPREGTRSSGYKLKCEIVYLNVIEAYLF